MQAILAIDQSTSATKALLFDTQGQIIDQVVGVMNKQQLKNKIDQALL